MAIIKVARELTFSQQIPQRYHDVQAEGQYGARDKLVPVHQ